MKYIIALISFAVAFSMYQEDVTPWLAVVLVIFGILALLSKSKTKRKRSKALYSTLDELADAIEAGEATLDPTIRAILIDIYDQVDSGADDIEDDDVRFNFDSLIYDLERAIYPKGMSEKQA